MQFRELDFRECHVFARALTALTRSLYLVSSETFRNTLRTTDTHAAAHARARRVTRAFTRAGSWTAVLEIVSTGKMVWMYAVTGVTIARTFRDATRNFRTNKFTPPRYTSIASITRRRRYNFDYCMIS